MEVIQAIEEQVQDEYLREKFSKSVAAAERTIDLYGCAIAIHACAPPPLLLLLPSAVPIRLPNCSIGGVAFSFNGGKDSTVLLHVLRAAVARHQQRSSGDPAAPSGGGSDETPSAQPTHRADDDSHGADFLRSSLDSGTREHAANGPALATVLEVAGQTDRTVAAAEPSSQPDAQPVSPPTRQQPAPSGSHEATGACEQKPHRARVPSYVSCTGKLGKMQQSQWIKWYGCHAACAYATGTVPCEPCLFFVRLEQIKTSVSVHAP